MAQVNAILKRLEEVTARLEKLEKSGGGGGGGAAPAAASGGSGAPASAWLAEYNEMVDNYIGTFFKQCEEIGGDIATQAAMVKGAFDAQKAFLAEAAKSKKPDNATVQAMLKPTATFIQQTQEFREANRPSKQFNHLSVWSEGITCLSWVLITPKPGPFAKEAGDSAEFYLNRVLKDNKDQRAWVNNIKEFYKALPAFIKKHHTTGLVWNPNGGAAKVPAGGAAPAASSGGPPPPPAGAPPKVTAPAKQSGGGAAALFAEINNKGAKGTVTTGLKKVTKDMKTKNRDPKERSAVVKAGAVKTGASSYSKRGGPKGDPKFALEGNKWVVEFQNENRSIVIEAPEKKHTVYIYGCVNSVVQIQGKVNSIAMDNCKKVGVVFTDAVAAVEVVNCQSIQVQVQGTVPTIALDKTSGAQIFLSRAALNCEILSAKCDEMNVSVPGKTDEDDMVEIALPEQYKSVYNAEKGHMETIPVMHG